MEALKENETSYPGAPAPTHGDGCCGYGGGCPLGHHDGLRGPLAPTFGGSAKAKAAPESQKNHGSYAY